MKGSRQLILLLILGFGFVAGFPLGFSFNVAILCPAALILITAFSVMVGPPAAGGSLAACLAVMVGGINLGYLCGCLCMPIQRNISG